MHKKNQFILGIAVSALGVIIYVFGMLNNASHLDTVGGSSIWPKVGLLLFPLGFLIAKKYVLLAIAAVISLALVLY